VQEYIPAIAATIAGIFAIVSPFITWKLKNSSDERARLIALDKERRDEIKRLYSDIIVQFELVIKQVLQGESFNLAREISDSTAKVHLLAPAKIAAQYFDVCSSLEEWSQLHYKATPPKTKVGEITVTLLRSPDPTARYKEPANAAYEKLQDELRKLIGLMRGELEDGAGLPQKRA
jgi:hypothetical protein